MPIFKSIYQPQEDSILLERYVRQYAFGKVLDIGTGSGIQAIAAAHNNNVKSVLATDIQKGVIDYCKKNIKNKTQENQRFSGHQKSDSCERVRTSSLAFDGFFSEIKFLQSDLFKNIKGKFDMSANRKAISAEMSERERRLNELSHVTARKPMVFDTIIFNPPYLPQNLKLRDLTIEGGKKGYEIIEKFVNEVNEFLSQDGIVLMVFSSLTKKEKIEEFIKNNCLDFEELEKIHIFFEDIHVYLLKKSQFLKNLESEGIKNIKYLTKGHRGLLFTGFYKNKKVAIKTKNPESKAIGRIENEARWLKELNKHNIGPKLLILGGDYFICEYIDGDLIINYIKKANRNDIKRIIKNIFNQLFILDKLKIDKEEMHHPTKHIIIQKDKSYLIDFERAHYAQNPKNVTQFCQFLISSYVSEILRNKKIITDKNKIIELAKIYKRNTTIENFRKITNMI